MASMIAHLLLKSHAGHYIIVTLLVQMRTVCPHGVLKKSEVVDNRGFFLPRVVDLDACKVCKLCEMECPDFAISVSAIDE